MLDDAIFAQSGLPRVYNNQPINGGSFANANLDTYDPSQALLLAGYTSLPEYVMLNFERIPDWTGAGPWLTKTIKAVKKLNPRCKIGLYDNRDGDQYRSMFETTFPSASISDGVDPWPLQNSFYNQWLKLRYKTCSGSNPIPVLHPMDIPKDNIVKILGMLQARGVSNICLWSWCSTALDLEKSRRIYDSIETIWNQMTNARGSINTISIPVTVSPASTKISNA